jgi:hypothetical protein
MTNFTNEFKTLESLASVIDNLEARIENFSQVDTSDWDDEDHWYNEMINDHDCSDLQHTLKLAGELAVILDRDIAVGVIRPTPEQESLVNRMITATM